MYARPSAIVTLTTDFGHRDPYVGIMKGALVAASDKPRVLDLSHSVAPQDIAMGSFMLWSAIGRFPTGTVHCGVVDPGVGTDRRLLAVTAHMQYWLVPDNALVGAVLACADTSEVRVIDLEHLGIQRTCRTFDGREVLAKAGAWLASGRYGFSAMGPRIEDADRTDLVFSGEPRVIHVDHYGNLVTNVRGDDTMLGRTITCAGHDVSVHKTFGEVAPGELLAYVGSFGLLEVAVSGGNAADRLSLQRGAAIAVPSA